ARSRIGIGCVLVVEVVLTDENDGKRPQRGHVHHFVENPLAQSALAEEADRYPVAPRALGGKGRAGGNPGTTGHDGVGPQVAALLVGDVHRSALPAAIPRRLAQELGEHPVCRRPLGQTVAVAAMRGGDVVVGPQRLAHANRHGFLAYIQVRQTRHLPRGIQLVDVFLEHADAIHLRVHRQVLIPVHRLLVLWARASVLGSWIASFRSPARCAITSHTAAKSWRLNPIDRAADSHSLVTAVVGSGTDVCRPSSSARLRSFCIIVTSNHASSGIRSTNGPRYFNIGDAITLLSSTATAVSRGIPPFSASATPSLKASICTARLRFVAIFMSTAWPFPPTSFTVGPMSWRMGLTRSKAARSPPTMIDNFPSSSVLTLPETAASNMCAPRRTASRP